MIWVLAQILIEFTAGDEEEHSMNALEDLYPLIALVPLAPHIVHAELLLTAAQTLGDGHAEGDFRDASGDLSAVQNVFCAGNVVDFTDSRKVVEEAEGKRQKQMTQSVNSSRDKEDRTMKLTI